MLKCAYIYQTYFKFRYKKNVIQVNYNLKVIHRNLNFRYKLHTPLNTCIVKFCYIRVIW